MNSTLRADTPKRPPLTEIHCLLTLRTLGSHGGVFRGASETLASLCCCLVVLLSASASFGRLEQVSPRARSLSLARVRLLCIPRHEPGGSIRPLVNITPPPSNSHDAHPRASITWCAWMDTSRWQLARMNNNFKFAF